MHKQPRPEKKSELWRYAGLSGQIFLSLGVAVFAGFKADDWLNLSIPLLVWLLPLIVLVVLIYSLLKETAKKKKDKI